MVDISEVASLGGVVIPTTRRVRHALTAPTGVVATSTTDRLDRILVQLPVTTSRWRIRARNWGPFAGTAGTANITLGDAYVGLPALGTGNAIGVPTGGFTAAPALAVPGAALGSAGAQYVSDWVTDPALQFQAGQLHLFSQGYTNSNAGTVGSGQMGVTFAVINNGGMAQAGLQAAPAGITSAIGQEIDRFIEYEFVAVGKVSVGVVISDSTGVGVSSTGVPVRPDQIWGARAAQSLGCPIMLGGMSGYSTSNFATPTNGVFSRLGLMTTADPDRIIPDFAILSIGVNDVAAVQNDSNTMTNIYTIAANLRALGIARIFITTPMQRLKNGITGFFSQGTLAVAAAIGDTSITTTVPIAPDTALGSYLGIEYGLANVELPRASAVSVVSGANWTTTLTAALTKAHAIGSPVESLGESYRKALNTRIRSAVGTFAGVFDFDRITRDPANLSAMQADLTVDALHPAPPASSLLAAAVQIPRAVQ
jgi:hypothetical protein